MDIPEGVSKSDFYVCVGAAKKLAELQSQYEEMDEKLVGEMRELIEKLEKRLERPSQEIEGLLAEYLEAVLLDALSSCKDYKKRSAVFPVEEMTKHVPDLQKLYKSDFNWTEDDVWNALEETWETARPCIPKSERDKIRRKAEKERQEKEQLAKEKEARSQTASRKNAGKDSDRAGGKDDPFSSLVAGQRLVKKVNGVEFAFRWCPPGKFTMGSPNNEAWHHNDEIQHEVTLTKGFWMLESEVTQSMWQVVMGNNPSRFKGPNRPVEQVNWGECQEFCRRLSSKLGAKFTLPTEAQWEYACRADSTGMYAGDLFSMGWCKDNAGGTTHPIGQKQPNAWGLYDMHGNVWEWCQDQKGGNTTVPLVDPVISTGSTNYIIRGGGWADFTQNCRSARRYEHPQDRRDGNGGFRIVQVPDGQKPLTPHMVEELMTNRNQFGENQPQFNGNQLGENQPSGGQFGRNKYSNGSQFGNQPNDDQFGGNQPSGGQFGKNKYSNRSGNTGSPRNQGLSSIRKDADVNDEEEDEDLDLDLDDVDDVNDKDMMDSYIEDDRKFNQPQSNSENSSSPEPKTNTRPTLHFRQFGRPK